MIGHLKMVATIQQPTILAAFKVAFRTACPLPSIPAFKPTSTISQEQTTSNKQGEQINLKIQGRHDPCVVPRAVPIVEAMAALTLIDFLVHRCQ